MHTLYIWHTELKKRVSSFINKPVCRGSSLGNFRPRLESIHWATSAHPESRTKGLEMVEMIGIYR